MSDLSLSQVPSADGKSAKAKDELRKHKEFIRKARTESRLCAIDGQHFILVPYWFMMDIEDDSNGY